MQLVILSIALVPATKHTCEPSLQGVNYTKYLTDQNGGHFHSETPDMSCRNLLANLVLSFRLTKGYDSDEPLTGLLVTV